MTGDLDLGTNQLQFDDVYLYRGTHYDLPVLNLRGGGLRLQHPVSPGTVDHSWEYILGLTLGNTTETAACNIETYHTYYIDHYGAGLYQDMAWLNLTSAKFFDGATYTDVTTDIREYYGSPTVSQVGLHSQTR